MSRAFLAEIIQETTEVSGAVAKQAAGQLVDAMAKQIKKTGSFTIPGFGTFKLAETKARKGLNPKTGEALKIKAGRTVRFKASKTLKEAMKGRR